LTNTGTALFVVPVEAAGALMAAAIVERPNNMTKGKKSVAPVIRKMIPVPMFWSMTTAAEERERLKKFGEINAVGAIKNLNDAVEVKEAIRGTLVASLLASESIDRVCAEGRCGELLPKVPPIVRRGLDEFVAGSIVVDPIIEELEAAEPDFRAWLILELNVWGGAGEERVDALIQSVRDASYVGDIVQGHLKPWIQLPRVYPNWWKGPPQRRPRANAEMGNLFPELTPAAWR